MEDGWRKIGELDMQGTCFRKIMNKKCGKHGGIINCDIVGGI
jgi:hypothetical protein